MSAQATPYALQDLTDRGIFFIQPGDPVYEGMVVGEHNKETDCEVNVARQKATTNVRSTVKQETVRLQPPRVMGVEELIAYMRDDEMIEVTPKRISLRKAILNSSQRQRVARLKKK